MYHILVLYMLAINDDIAERMLPSYSSSYKNVKIHFSNYRRRKITSASFVVSATDEPPMVEAQQPI